LHLVNQIQTESHDDIALLPLQTAETLPNSRPILSS
jgi:hypothetical protein